MVGIYKITCTENNKEYIGSSMDIEKRFKAHKTNLNKNNHSNRCLQEDWNLYGEDKFEFKIIRIMEGECANKKLIEFVEYRYIRTCRKELYNILGKLIDKNYYKDKWRKEKTTK